MKRFGHLLESIISYDNIRLAYLKALRGSSHSSGAVLFASDLNCNLESLRSDFASGTYRMLPYSRFVIRDPKERLISAADFRDRVAHHAIMNVLEPVLERRQIFHSYACRKGKGSHAAVRALFGKCRFGMLFLKLDIRKYFDSVDHRLLLSMLERIIKDRAVMRILESIIGSYHTVPDKGLPIGNLTSQHFANLYLSSLDHYVLEHSRPSFYVRYMDDMVILERSRSLLRSCLGEISHFVSVCLDLSLKQPVINSVGSGIPFLGYLVSLNSVGLLGRSKRRKFAKLEEIDCLYESGEISFEQAMIRRDSVEEYRNHLVSALS